MFKLSLTKSIIFICWLAGFSLPAQQIKITGTVCNAKDGSPVESAAVQLFTADSVAAGGCASDKKGRFLLNASRRADHLLLVTCLGYQPLRIRIHRSEKDISLGKCPLVEDSRKLEEITVSAGNLITTADRQLIFPSAVQLKTSSTGLELLQKMMLPGLFVNTTQNTVSSMGNGSIQFRINNVQASTAQLIALNPEHVARVEYIDQPGLRYGENVTAVINFITKPLTDGVTGGVNLRNAVTTGYGNDNVYAKYNCRSSEFGLIYAVGYRNFTDKYSLTNQRFLQEDGSYRVLEKEGTGAPYRWRQHAVTLSYNWQKPGKAVFSAILRNRFTDNPANDVYQQIREENRENRNSYLAIDDRDYLPSLDLYYNQQFARKQNLTVSAGGSYLTSDYNRDYTEWLGDDPTPVSRKAYATDGEKYAFAGEAIYEKSFENRLVYGLGANYSQGYIENRYEGATGDVKNTMRHSNLHVFTQLRGSWKKINLQLGLGFSRQYFKENEGRYTYYTFRPVVSAMYRITDNASLRYSFSINPVLPSLASLSDVEQWQNDYEMIQGNPFLKPYRAYANTLTFQWKIKRWLIQAAGYCQYSPKPIMSTQVERVDREDDIPYFIYGSDNQKNFIHVQARTFISGELIRDRLFLSLVGVMNRHINHGNEYTHTRTGFFGRAQLEGNYKNWSFSASVYSRMKSLFAETLQYGSPGSDISVAYKYKTLKVGAGIMNPFQPSGNNTGSRLISDLVYKESRTHQKAYGNMVYLSLTWNFTQGRKYRSQGKNVNHADGDSGIVK